jgi:protein gp37
MHDKIKRLLEREGTGISWAHLTFNPWIGCQKVSPACDHCYAEELATNRLGVQWGPGAERRRTAPGTWGKVARWNRIAEEAGERLTVFCASLADVLDNAVDDQWRRDLAAQIIATPWLDWMLLTKRIGNARKMLSAMFPDGVPPNVALGVTIANQEEADRDLPRALSVKAGLGIKRLFVSMEPLLGYVDITRFLSGIDLVIVGGESGKDARPLEPVWARAIRDRCAQARVPFHFKQWGEWLPGGQGNPHGVDLGRYEIRTLGEDANKVITGYRVGTKKSGHRLDGREHREHFQ